MGVPAGMPVAVTVAGRAGGVAPLIPDCTGQDIAGSVATAGAVVGVGATVTTCEDRPAGARDSTTGTPTARATAGASQTAQRSLWRRRPRRRMRSWMPSQASAGGGPSGPAAWNAFRRRSSIFIAGPQEVGHGRQAAGGVRLHGSLRDPQHPADLGFGQVQVV